MGLVPTRRVRVLADRKLLDVFSNGAVDEIRLTFGTYLVREDADPPELHMRRSVNLFRRHLKARLKVGLEIGKVFDTDRESDEPISDAVFLSNLFGNRGMSHDRWMFY